MTDEQLRAFVASVQRTADRAQQWRRENDAAITDALKHLERASGWALEHQAEIEQFLGRLRELDRAADEARARWDGNSLEFLVEPLDRIEHLVLSLHATPDDGGALLDLLQEAVCDNTFVEAVVAQLVAAESLGEMPRRHLVQGLIHLGERDFVAAWPPLIIGLEGAFADIAVRDGLLVRKGENLFLPNADGSASTQRYSGVESVIRDLGHGAQDSVYGRFLIRHVFGGTGNPFRHGIAQAGVRDEVVCLAAAVVGWLDAFVIPGVLTELGDAIRRELERRLEELPPPEGVHLKY